MSSSRASEAKHRRRPDRPPRKVRPRRREPRPSREWELIDLLPSSLPITDAEIEVLDKMLGGQIDAILKS
jgi:hypothetical protein